MANVNNSEFKGFPQQVAVLGAGLMGSQIAAHLVNAGLKVMLFGLPASGADANAKVHKAIEELVMIEPPPLTLNRYRHRIIAANYYQDLKKLQNCDLVIEAISESFDNKEGFYVRIAPYIGKQAIFTSTTSRLSINRLARALPEALRSRFCGMHFFNPPRYRRLVELIPAQTTDPKLLDQLETFLVGSLGKGVVRAKDTPYFIANRVGLLALLTTMHYAERFALAPDLVDELTVAGFGLTQEATFNRLDDIGLNTFFGALIRITRALPDDPWLTKLRLPQWLRSLFEQHHGQSGSQPTIYRWQQHQLDVIDPDSDPKNIRYRPYAPSIAASVQTSLNIDDPVDRIVALRANSHPQAQFLWSVLRDVLHYVAVYLDKIAYSGHDVDLALRLGFGWQIGPFEAWQMLGWPLTADWIEQDRKNQKTFTQVPLPEWVHKINTMYCTKGVYAPAQASYQAYSSLPIYRRQLPVAAIVKKPPPTSKSVIFESDTIQLWKSNGAGNGDGNGNDADIVILSRNHRDVMLSPNFLIEMQEALTIAEENHQALILWDQQVPLGFPNSAPYNATKSTWRRSLSDIHRCADERQHIHQRLRNAAIPVIGTAPQTPLAQCDIELLLHCDRVVVALECQLGFPQLSEGLFPAHGGCAELLQRALIGAKNEDMFALIQFYFDKLSSHGIAQNAVQAQQWGWLDAADSVIFNPDELLYVAKAQARQLIDVGYRPPLSDAIPVLGHGAIEALLDTMHQRLEQENFNQQNYYISERLAYVLCGGDAAANQHLEREQLLALERQAFAEIIEYIHKT